MTLKEYWEHWCNPKIKDEVKLRAKEYANKIISLMPEYEAVTKVTGVPTHVIGVIDYRESFFNHKTYLANGDPLFDQNGLGLKTSHVPKGLGPVKNWAEGAILSFKHQGFDLCKNWSIAHALFALEMYNGLGYHKRGKKTPYLWSGTKHYICGKYVADGKFDPLAKDKQLGCVPILYALKEKGLNLNETAIE